MMALALEATNIEGGYELPSNFLKAVDRCSLTAHEGEILGIAGESACGKSTFAHLIMGYAKPPLKLVSGKSIICGIDGYSLKWKERKTRLWGRTISMIPQASMNALNPVKKIRDVVSDVFKEKSANPPQKREMLRIATERFAEVGLDQTALDMYSIELSGGMKQRAVIAISTLLGPSVLIADEPTSALDVSTQRMLLELLYGLVEKGIVKTLIFISHDIATLRQICNRTCIMYAGKIVEISDTESIIGRPSHPYTQGLMGAVVSVDVSLREVGLKGIPGAPPNLLDPPRGCRFHPRCPHVMPVCREDEPPLERLRNETYSACWLHVK